MPLFRALQTQWSMLQARLRREFVYEPKTGPHELDLRFLEDRVLYSGVALAAELLAAEGTGVDGHDPQADGTLTGDSANPNAFSGWITSESPESNSYSVAQLEASLQGLDELLAELSASENTLQVVDDAATDPMATPSFVGDPAGESSIDNRGGDDSVGENMFSDNMLRSTSIDRLQELIVIDTAVPDYEALLSTWQLDQGADREFTVLLVDPSVNGVEFISEFLADSERQYSAIHLVTHGFSGGLLLGNVELNEGNLSTYAMQFATWQMSLTEDADLLLYGCSIASGSAGKEFVESWASLLTVDVAASTDRTGAQSLGGDWDLEYEFGQVDPRLLLEPAIDQGWQFLLPTNSAPVLDSLSSPTLGSVLEGATNPSGVTVASLIVDGSITDPDGSAVEAIAITGLNTSLGTWQYSLDGGTSWLTIDANLINSQTNELALLLGPTAQLRLIPFGDLSGSVSDAITFRAWDQTSGSEGQYTVITSTGDTSAFSSASDTASITVTAVNDAPTFLSGDGIITTAIGTSTDSGQSVIIQPDGKIVVGGYARIGSTDDFALVRYNIDGSLDSSFGTGGMVSTAIGMASDVGYNVSLQPDGKIVVGGYARIGSTDDFALVRYNADGSLDTTFGTGGKVITAIGTGTDRGYSVTVQPDGKIVVGGYTRIGFTDDFALVRYNSDGTLDATFGTGGRITTAIGSGEDTGWSVALQSDGKIVFGGSAWIGTTDDFALVRYNADGTLDNTFGTGGIVTTAVGTSGDALYEIFIQADGKIIVGGTVLVGNTTDFALVRLNANGTLDSSFGDGGRVTTAIGIAADQGYSVSVQPDGKIIIAGFATVGSTSDFALVRYNTDGSVDTTFGTGGKVTTAIGTNHDYGRSVTIQTDGKIVVAGYATIGSTTDFALVRYNADGSLDTTFDLASTLGGSVSYTENGSPVVLDSDARVFDVDLSSSNFSGATLTLVRNGGANAQDLFSATGTLGTLTQGGNLVVGGTSIGTVTTNSSGTLVLTFNSNATNALVNSAMQQIAYANSSEAPPSSVQIDWTFNDGNSGSQGTGEALTATGNVIVNISRMVMRWKLDDTGSGSYVGQESTQRSTMSVSDASGYGIDGSMINMEGTEWVDGRTGGALDLNGVNAAAYDYVVSNVGLNLVPTKYTVAFWVKADTVGVWNPILGEEASAQTGPDWTNFLFHSGPSGVVYMGQNGVKRFSLAAGTLAVGSWTHFAMTFDNGTARAYVNGTLMGTQTGWAIGSTWSKFYLGGPQAWAGTNAKLDDIRIYDGALSTSDIRMIANPPSLGAIESYSAAYIENGAAVSLTSALTLSDADNSTMSSATIAIVGNRTVGDVLTFTNQNGITGAYNLNTGVLTLSGMSSSANYQAALRSVQFSSTSDDPTAGGSASTRTIAFLVNDGQLDSNPARRVVDVTPLNDAPISVPDYAIAIERGGYLDGSVGVDPTGNVLTNDMDLDGGDTKTVIGIAAGTLPNAAGNVGSSVIGNYGSILISSNGEYTYTVDNNHPTVRALRSASETLSDVFSYTVRDAGGLTSTTQVTITIQGANERPIAMGESYQTNFLTPFTMRWSDLLANDTDVEGDALSIQILSLPARGLVVMDSNGGMTYRPEANFVGTVTLVYAVSDGSLVSDPQTIQIAISMPPTTVVALTESQGVAALSSIDPIASSTAIGSINRTESTPTAITGNSSDSGNANSAVRQGTAASLSAAGAANTAGNASTVVSGSPGDQSVSVNVAEARGGAMDWDGRYRLNTAMEDIDFLFDHEHLHLNWITGFKMSSLGNIQRLQLDAWNRVRSEPDENQFFESVQSKEEVLLEVRSRDYMVRTAAPIMVGSAIGAGISLHVLMTAHFGSSLLSQSGIFMPLDPLTILEGSAKVAKSKEREDLLFDLQRVDRIVENHS